MQKVGEEEAHKSRVDTVQVWVAPLDAAPSVLAARADAFLRWWTAKEAYLKATGLGLSFPPDRVEMGTDSHDGAVPVLADGRPSGWWVRPVRPAPGYVAAVAARGRACEVRIRAVSMPTLTPP